MVALFRGMVYTRTMDTVKESVALLLNVGLTVRCRWVENAEYAEVTSIDHVALPSPRDVNEALGEQPEEAEVLNNAVRKALGIKETTT